ncbi:uncharacterized protein BO97DRAFT_408830, partial [Aspergillus homomorphus CBS 101889]
MSTQNPTPNPSPNPPPSTFKYTPTQPTPITLPWLATLTTHLATHKIPAALINRALFRALGMNDNLLMDACIDLDIPDKHLPDAIKILREAGFDDKPRDWEEVKPLFTWPSGPSREGPITKELIAKLSRLEVEDQAHRLADAWWAPAHVFFLWRGKYEPVRDGRLWGLGSEWGGPDALEALTGQGEVVLLRLFAHERFFWHLPPPRVDIEVEEGEGNREEGDRVNENWDCYLLVGCGGVDAAVQTVDTDIDSDIDTNTGTDTGIGTDTNTDNATRTDTDTSTDPGSLTPTPTTTTTTTPQLTLRVMKPAQYVESMLMLHWRDHPRRVAEEAPRYSASNEMMGTSWDLTYEMLRELAWRTQPACLQPDAFRPMFYQIWVEELNTAPGSSADEEIQKRITTTTSRCVGFKNRLVKRLLDDGALPPSPFPIRRRDVPETLREAYERLMGGMPEESPLPWNDELEDGLDILFRQRGRL